MMLVNVLHNNIYSIYDDVKFNSTNHEQSVYLMLKYLVAERCKEIYWNNNSYYIDVLFSQYHIVTKYNNNIFTTSLKKCKYYNNRNCDDCCAKQVKYNFADIITHHK